MGTDPERKYLDINPANADKGEIIKFLAKKMNYSSS